MSRNNFNSADEHREVDAEVDENIERTHGNKNRCPSCRSILPIGSGICMVCSGAQPLTTDLFNDEKYDACSSSAA